MIRTVHTKTSLQQNIVHSFADQLHDLRREVPLCVVLWRNFSLTFKTWVRSSQVFNSREIHPHLTVKANWNNHDKVWKSEVFLSDVFAAVALVVAWVPTLTHLKCTHPPNSPQDLPLTYFLLVGIAFACSLHEPKDRGGNQNEISQHCTFHGLSTFKTLPPTFFCFCLFACCWFFPISHNVKIYHSFSAIFVRSSSRIKKGTSPRNRSKSRSKNRPGKRAAHFS